MLLLKSAPNLENHKRASTEKSKLSDRVNDLQRRLDKEVSLREAAEVRLHTIQTFHKVIADNFAIGWIGILNDQLQYTYVDGKGLERLGIEPEKLLGKYFLKTIKAQEIGRLLRKVQDTACSVIFEVTHNDRIFEVQAAPFPDGNKGIILILHDITTLKSTQKELRQSLAKEKELGELKSRFVTLASHEFRTPLTTILTSSFLLESYTGDKYELTKATHIARIKRSVKAMTEILNDFLSVGKLEEGQVKANFEPICVSEFIKALELELEPLKRDQQKLMITYSGNDILLSDKKLLRNILYNLASNAFKYTHNYDQVRIDLLAEKGKLRMRIVDHGIGIPQEEQKYIFKRFYRAHNASNIQGTGLGLTIVKKYIHLLGGTIDFISNENQGTVFSVTIPAVPTQTFPQY
jgi:signal transduction histidine kinase